MTLQDSKFIKASILTKVLILQTPERLLTGYFLPLTYGFMVMLEETPFSYSLAVNASLEDIGKYTLSYKKKVDL